MSNLVTKHYPVSIYDVSGNEELFTLAKSGFEFTKCPVPMREWTDRFMTEEYNPKLENWLKEYLNCESVFIYSYNVSVPDKQSAGSLTCG